MDTDPYYRLHRIRSIVQGDWFYPLFEPLLNYPGGWYVSWPLGLDYIIATPLKLLGVQDHASIMIAAFMMMPLLILPILFLTGSIASKLSGEKVVGLAAGLFVTLIGALLPQTRVGSVDHHGLEAMFILFQLWWLLRLRNESGLWEKIGFALCLGLSPSIYPHAWIPTVCVCLYLLLEKNQDYLEKVSKSLFYAFGISLIPLYLSSRFEDGYVSISGFSWWSTFILILSSFYALILKVWRSKKIENPRFFSSVISSLLIVSAYLIYKNGRYILGEQIGEGVGFVLLKKGTLASTTEMQSPFTPSLEMFGELVLLFILPLVYGWFIYFKRHLQVLLYCLPVVLLAYTQVRFIVPATGGIAILTILWFWDILQRFPIKRIPQTLVLFAMVLGVSFIYMPEIGITRFTADTPYFQPIQHASIFLKKQVKDHGFDPKQTSVMASWDYGHWVLFYSGLPVIASPFQGVRAVENYEFFASEDPHMIEKLEKETPAKYLIVEQFPGRFYNVLEFAGKDLGEYFNFKKDKGDEYLHMTAKPRFAKVLFQRFLVNYGADDEGGVPSHWRLIYTSPYPAAQFSKDAPALKIFEQVRGAVVQIHSKEKELWLMVHVVEKGLSKKVKIKSKPVAPGVLQWTVPYSEYEGGDVTCDGVYRLMDKSGKVLGVLPTITDQHVEKGEVLYVR